MILYCGCQHTQTYAHTDRSAHSLNYWEHPSLHQMVRLASLQRPALHHPPSHIKDNTSTRYEKAVCNRFSLYLLTLEVKSPPSILQPKYGGQ